MREDWSPVDQAVHSPTMLVWGQPSCQSLYFKIADAEVPRMYGALAIKLIAD